MFDVIVIGGGPAGLTAALRARELGAAVALVERDRLGGTCTNDGCVPTRVLAKAARLMRDSRDFQAYGLSAEKPVIHFSDLLNRTQHVVDAIHEKKQMREHLVNVGASVFTEAGPVSFLDPNTIQLGDESRLQAQKFIICAGGHARQLSFPGSQYALGHDDIWSMRDLPASIAIVGAAHTGSQLASIFSAFGSQVWLLEAADRILAREDVIVSSEMSTAMQQQGIRIITGIGAIEKIEKEGHRLRLSYDLHGRSDEIEVEAVLVSVGWVGNIEGLNLDAAGVKTERGYILVNDYFQTTNPNIFAAGDITGRMMLVQSGSIEGKIAAENAVLAVAQPYQHRIVPHGGFTDPEYASVGLTEAQARLAQPDNIVVEIPYADLDRALIDDSQQGACKLIVSAETHHILGAHVVGEQALEIVQSVAAGMAAELCVEQLAELELAYPTYTAILGLAARQAVKELHVLPLAQPWDSLSRPRLAEWERSAIQ